MVDASDIPERLRRVGRNQAELARHLKLDPSSLTKTIRGNRRLKADEMLAVEDFFRAAGEPTSGATATSGADPGTRDTAPRLRGSSRKFPLYGYMFPSPEGDRVAVAEEIDVVDWLDAPPFWAGVGELAGVRIVGSSMEPRLFEGEIAVMQVNLPPQPGRDCVVELASGGAIVRTYVGRKDAYVILRKWNPQMDERRLEDEIKAIHAVIWRR